MISAKSTLSSWRKIPSEKTTNQYRGILQNQGGGKRSSREFLAENVFYIFDFLLVFILLLITMSRKQTPSDFLKQIIGRPVVVKLNSGADYRGVLACLDSYMNIALEQTEEYVNGQLKNKYGDAFIRGNNVLYISTQKSRR